MDAPRATGGCLCGAVRYAVTGPLRDVLVCHCSRCRRSHGHIAAYSACADADLELVEASGLRWYVSDERERGFCGACGASLLWRVTGAARTSVAAGSLDPPTGLKVIAQIYVADRGDYYQPSDEGARFDGGSP